MDLALALVRCCVQVDQRRTALARSNPIPERTLRHDGFDSGARQEGGDAGARHLGVERQVGAAGLERADEAHHQRRRALQADADPRLGSDAAGAESPRQNLGAPVQLAVGEHLVAADHGRRIGSPRRLLGEQVGQGGLLPIGNLGAVPGGDELRFLLGRQERQGETGAEGRPRCRPGGARNAGSSARRWPLRKSCTAVVVKAGGEALPTSPIVNVRSNWAIRCSSGTTSSRRPPTSTCAPASPRAQAVRSWPSAKLRLRSTNMAWKRGERPGSRSGSRRLDQQREGVVLVPEGAERLAAERARSASNVGVASPRQRRQSGNGAPAG
jgi:hypothetical protein